MVTRIKSNKIITPQGIAQGYVYFEDATITEVSAQENSFDREVDLTGLYVSPGFIDLHTHGGNGYDFRLSEEAVVEGSNFHLRHGTTTILPTISAAPLAEMREGVLGVEKAMKNPRCHVNVLGAHLEGPYFSKNQVGAQAADHITPPIAKEYEPLVEELSHAIARWSYAPEEDTDGKFSAYLKDKDILLSAGHTDAKYEHMKQAMENGCNLVTHLYSCTSTVTRNKGFRSLGVIESAFLEDDLYVEIIADGKHLPPDLIRMILKIKGTDHVALVTDSLAIAGTDATGGSSVAGGFIVEDGVCKLPDRSAFAGSIATADRLVRVVTRETGVDLCEAVKMITQIPAKILGVNKGDLAAGKDADIIAFDDDIQVKKAFVMGKEIF